MKSLRSLALTLFAIASSTLAFAQDAPTLAAKVAVLGQVAQPGTFFFKPVKVSDAILAAGGLTKDADTSKITVRRGFLIDPAHSKEVRYDFGRVRDGKAADLDVQPGDVIEVSKRSGKKGILGKLEGAAKSLGKTVGSAARPLLEAASPALKSIAEKIGLLRADPGREAPVPFVPTSRTANGPVQVTALESALLRALAAESSDVRDRVLKQVQAILAPSSK